MSTTHDPKDELAAALESDDSAVGGLLRDIASVDMPDHVRIDETLAALISVPEPVSKRRRLPAMLLRPVATLASAFVAVVVVAAGAVAVVGPQEVIDTITRSTPAIDAGTELDPVSVLTSLSDESAERPTDGPDAKPEDPDRDKPTADDPDTDDRSDDPKGSGDNEVNEEAVAAFVACIDSGFDTWFESLADSETLSSPGVLGTCEGSDEGSLGQQGHDYLDAVEAWMGCASTYAHESSKDGDAESLADTCGEFPDFEMFDIDIPDGSDPDRSDRTEKVQRRGDELGERGDRAGEGQTDTETDVRNDDGDVVPPSRSRTREG